MTSKYALAEAATGNRFCRIVEIKIRGNILKKNLAACIVDGTLTQSKPGQD